jgi:hypothetical protein
MDRLQTEDGHHFIRVCTIRLLLDPSLCSLPARHYTSVLAN